MDYRLWAFHAVESKLTKATTHYTDDDGEIPNPITGRKSYFHDRPVSVPYPVGLVAKPDGVGPGYRLAGTASARVGASPALSRRNCSQQDQEAEG